MANTAEEKNDCDTRKAYEMMERTLTSLSESSAVPSLNGSSVSNDDDDDDDRSDIDESKWDDDDNNYDDHPADIMRTSDERKRKNWIESQSKYAAENLKVLGHRGSMYQELENTRRGFQLVSEMGCNGFELDVFLLSCGTLVVYHGGGSDANPGLLDGYCHAEGSILDYKADEVSRIKFNADSDKFVCCPDKIRNAYIPTLEEVLLDARETDVMVKIELKGSGTAEPAVRLVEKLDMTDQVAFSSFDHDRIATVRKMRPELNDDGTHMVRTGALFNHDISDNFVEEARKVGASEVHFRYDTCTRERVEKAHEAGMDTMAWFRGPIGMGQDLTGRYKNLGCEGEEMYRIVMASGVQSMCVNRPDVLLDMTQEG
mmetsp:Transcript_16079/g.22067  ORF Transcript_16079/g.22067 Transcript_16079/m.22067 type:complete len:372 (-) Transcript_16079:411-1526(-)|eukprot:CAMPEP_0185739724 /NCGR_PEP_ID=MMETSP1171-20130828/36086_1 /TAXON_ID=374046 /ORGANISM="Helicotheca tamensis, Strain CCMP826" /LENGTH=371 /DNA_ID=CAMNT_0028411361 /DNA_START=37 /DNA_END=1152 /DNA_ORIENTATION=-